MDRFNRRYNCFLCSVTAEDEATRVGRVRKESSLDRPGVPDVPRLGPKTTRWQNTLPRVAFGGDFGHPHVRFEAQLAATRPRHPAPMRLKSTRREPFQPIHTHSLHNTLLSPSSHPSPFSDPSPLPIHPSMATQNLKQRPQDDAATATAIAAATTTTPTTYNVRTKRAKRLAMARRGLRSLAVAVGIPLSLTLLSIFAFGTRCGDYPLPLLPVWVIHFASLSSACLMGLSGWLMWAEGGFHQQPTALSLYVAQFVLAMLWTPIVLGWGGRWLGLLVCAMLFVALYGCSLRFRRVNPIAGDLVKPVLAWAAFLGLMNYKLA
ncbi:hypothetical protein ACLOJK_026159 [Asimina triloba]